MEEHTTKVESPMQRETAAPIARVTRWLLVGGIVGPILFVVVYTLEGATRPGYDARSQAVSSLSLSGWGWMQILNFVVCGALVIGFALGLGRVLVPGARGATWGPRLIGMVGLGLLCAGVFVTDPAQGYPASTPQGPAATTTLHGTLHFALGATGFFGLLPVACFVMARYFSGRAGWRGWTAYSIVTGILMYASFAGFIVASTHRGPAGLFERLAISIGMLWLMLLAARWLLHARGRIARRGR